jgi:hypothetical protein
MCKPACVAAAGDVAERVVDEFVGEIGKDRGLVGASAQDSAGGDERRPSNEGLWHCA